MAGNKKAPGLWGHAGAFGSLELYVEAGALIPIGLPQLLLINLIGAMINVDILGQYVPFIKEQAEHQRKNAVNLAEKSPKIAAKATSRAERFEQLLEDIQKVSLQLSTPPSLPAPSASSEPKRPRFTLLPADLEGLPEEVLKQLGINESDRQELAIVEMIEEAGGMMALDQIIIALWRQKQEVADRGKLTSKLYRMTQKKMIYGAGKGIYSTKPVEGGEISESEAE